MDKSLFDKSLQVLEAKTKLIKFCEDESLNSSGDTLLGLCEPYIKELSEQICNTLKNPDLLRTVKNVSSINANSDRMLLNLCVYILPVLQFGIPALEVEYIKNNVATQATVYKQQLIVADILFDSKPSDYQFVAAILGVKTTAIKTIRYVPEDVDTDVELNFNEIHKHVRKYLKQYISDNYKPVDVRERSSGCIPMVFAIIANLILAVLLYLLL